jgi:hypothetical protein
VVYVPTREVWWPRGGERGYERIRDGKATYPSVADRDFIARYGRGENRFEPREGPYAVRTVALGNTELTLDQLGALPKTVPALDARLRREFRKAIGPVPANKKISYSAFVWDCAALLLAEPISPGTKAALFRLLAGQRGLRAVGRAKDPLGRYGVAFAWQAPKEERRLIIDPASGRELAVVDTPREQGTPGHWTAYEAMNWTDTISGRSDRVVESPKK